MLIASPLYMRISNIEMFLCCRRRSCAEGGGGVFVVVLEYIKLETFIQFCLTFKRKHIIRMFQRKKCSFPLKDNTLCTYICVKNIFETL